jgi:hypothetical protein
VKKASDSKKAKSKIQRAGTKAVGDAQAKLEAKSPDERIATLAADVQSKRDDRSIESRRLALLLGIDDAYHSGGDWNLWSAARCAIRPGRRLPRVANPEGA